MTRPEFVAQGSLVLPIVAVGALFYGLYGAIFAWILIVVKRTRLIFVLVSFSALINLFLNMLFIPIYVGVMILAGAGIYFGLLILVKGFGEEEVGF